MKSEKMFIPDVDKIIALIEEIKALNHRKDAFFRSLQQASNNAILLERFLQGKSEQDHRDVYNRQLLHLLDKLELLNENIVDALDEPLEGSVPTKNKVVNELKVLLPSKRVYQSKTKRTKYLKDIGMSAEVLKRLSKPERIKKLTQIDYTVYKIGLFGSIANIFCRALSSSVSKNYPDFYEKIRHSLRMSDMKVLARTYMSIVLFSSLLTFIVILAAGVLLNLFLFKATFIGFMASIAISIILSVCMFFILYLYPSLIVGGRRRLIKNDLPFAIMHMAAIAGSGAPPVTMFRLLLNSGEYKGLESEIKKIVNYVNLFGYDLSTALKTVAAATPSKRFKDVLSGIAATVESGGSLKSYLNSMAEDTMTTYRLERKKYVESLATYSDLYTGILIAAPLLFIVTLAIINILGGAVGGFSVGTLATFGTYLVIPVLNVGFILFLNIVQPE